MNKSRNLFAWLLATILLATVVIFVVDLSVPLGVAGGVPYVAVVLLSLWLPQKRYTVMIAALSSALTILGYFYSPSGGVVWVVLANRFLALFAIWVTAMFVLQRKQTRGKEDLQREEEQGETTFRVNKPGNTVALLLATILLATVVIFVLDLSLPLGVAGGVPYVAVVLLSLWLPQKRYTVMIAALSSALTILGYYYSPSGGVVWVVLANRFLALFAIWVTALLVLQRKQTDEKEIVQQEKEQRELARIGRVISSSLNMDSVYQRFAELVKSLVPFDRMIVDFIDFVDQTLTVAYSSDGNASGRGAGDVVPLSGSFAMESVESREAVIFHPLSRDEVEARCSVLVPGYDAGMRSFLAVLLKVDDQDIGTLQFRSRAENVYTEYHRRFAELVATQISGAIANSQLHATVEREAKEREILARIGRIVSSSLDVNDVYDSLGEQVNTLIPADRVAIALIDLPNQSLINTWTSGLEVLGRKPHETLPLAGTLTNVVVQNRAALIIGSGDGEQLIRQYPGMRPAIEAGLQSFLSAPMISNDQLIGILYFNSIEPSAYTPAHLALAQSIADQISGAVTNSHLHAERVRLEDQLIHAQKMEAVGLLAGGVAHDFNNMLSAVTSYTQLTLNGLPPGDRLAGYLEEVQKAAERCANLTRQLLAFSRKQIVMPKVFDLSELILDMDKMLRRLITEDIELVVLFDLDPVMVNMDPGQMEQVLANLVVNARDAMPDGGMLTIKIEGVTRDDDNGKYPPGVIGGEYVLLTVSDTGVGMSEEIKARIAEPFFTTKEVGKGTGLGLSTCYGIVAQSGGIITFDSQVGRGTVFKVYFPQAEVSDGVSLLRDESGDMPEGNETVLLVEDEPLVRQVAKLVLIEQGYTVWEAANGVEALNMLDGHGDDRVDLLLTDMVMPLMGGRDLAERFSELRPEAKVLYTSGYTDDAIVRLDTHKGSIDFMQKPFTPSGLTRKVREVLDKV